MTRAEARRRAVEAAGEALLGDVDKHWQARRLSDKAISAYERAMADAGWRMGRDVAHLDGVGEFMVADNERMRQAMVWARMAGWNACRAAMLADPDA